ncbi:hypothetical protein AVEN_138861-1, partial [Araneus ventricosus]
TRRQALQFAENNAKILWDKIKSTFTGQTRRPSKIDAGNEKKGSKSSNKQQRIGRSSQDIKRVRSQTKVNHLEISAEPAANENNCSIPFETPDDTKSKYRGSEIETLVAIRSCQTFGKAQSQIDVN